MHIIAAICKVSQKSKRLYSQFLCKSPPAEFAFTVAAELAYAIGRVVRLLVQSEGKFKSEVYRQKTPVKIFVL